MRNKCVFTIITISLVYLFVGCKSSFYHLSKKISNSYADSRFAADDLRYNHAIRIKIKKNGLIDNYKIGKDTITFAQYIDRHVGDVAIAVILNRKTIFPFNDTSTLGQIDKETFSPLFLDALVKWDTTQISSIPQEKSVHKGVIYITRVVNGKIVVLNPRSYEMNE